MQDRITRSRLAGEPADIVISPRLSHIGLLDFDSAAAAIEYHNAILDHYFMTADPAEAAAIDAGRAEVRQFSAMIVDTIAASRPL